MTKKIKFALKMKDGVEVRTLQELKDGFDLNAVMAYFLDGKLESWLSDRYYDDLADSIQELDKNDPELRKKLCGVFGVEYENDAMSIEEIEERNRRINRLKEITDDESIIENVDSVAFSQEELADLLDEGKETIYLCGTDFKIPVRKKNITYIGVNTMLTLSREECEKYAQNNIEFINLIPEVYDMDKGEKCEEMNEIDTNQALFICKGPGGSGCDENFIAYTVSELQKHEIQEGGDEDDEDEVEFLTKLHKVKTPEISRYLDAVYDGKRIIYLAEDGQGTLLATMGIDGKNVNVIRRWDENEREELKKYYLGQKYIFVSYTKEDEESDVEYLTERISINGEIVRIDDSIFLNGWENHIEMKDGLYSISFDYDWEDEDGGWLNIKYLPEGSNISSWNVHDDKIYFYLYDSDDEGRFYCFNIENNKVNLASKVFVDCEIRAFCVSHEGIYFNRCKEDEDSELVFLNFKTGKIVTLWRKIDSLKQIRIIGNYIYLLPGAFFEKKFLAIFFSMFCEKNCYRMKLDGMEKTHIDIWSRNCKIEKFC